MDTAAFINVDLIRKPRDFDGSQFVNRERERSRVQNIVDKLQHNRPISEAIVSFWGISGSGKTWLLRHLEEIYRYRHAALNSSQSLKPTVAIYLAFDRLPINVRDCAAELAEKLLQQLGPSLNATDREELEAAKDQKSLYSVSLFVRKSTALFVPIFLFDNAENVTAETWAEIETAFLDPIVSTNQALVIIGGRKKIPNWKLFEVRRKASSAIQIEPFSKSDIQEQLSRFDYNIPADSLFPYSGGTPRVVDTIASHLLAWSGGFSQKVDTAEATSKIRDYSSDLAKVFELIEDYVFEDFSYRIRDILNEISVLRYFLPATLKDLFKYEQPFDYRGLILELSSANLVGWSREYQAHTMSPNLRQLLDRKNLVTKPAWYITEHKRLHDWYWKKAEEAGKSSAQFLVEIWFHALSIFIANGDDNAFAERIDRSMSFALETLDKDSGLIQLQKALDTTDGNQELLDLMPEKTLRRIRSTINQKLAA